MKYSLEIKKEAHQDIQSGINWYDSRQKGLGKRFHSAVKKGYEVIRSNPYFQVRYENVRCLSVRKFPYMLHYIVNEKRKRLFCLVLLIHIKPLKNGKIEYNRLQLAQTPPHKAIITE